MLDVEVHRGELAFDRTLNLSTSLDFGKPELQERLPTAIETMKRLRERNSEDFRKLMLKKTSQRQRTQLARRIWRTRKALLAQAASDPVLREFLRDTPAEEVAI